MHCCVHKYNDFPPNSLLKKRIDLKFKRINNDTDEDFADLVEIDPWDIQKEEIPHYLQEGCVCYADRHKGEIIACVRAFLWDEFDEIALRRTLRLASNEAYDWRGACAKAMRGKGVLPFLSYHAINDLSREFNNTAVLAIT